MRAARSSWAGLAVALLIVAQPAAGQDHEVVLHGTVVTPDAVINDGWLTLKDGRISQVSTEHPDLPQAAYVETQGTIYPGFVDLHNHPMYAVFERWEPYREFVNRYEWRKDPAYESHVGQPGAVLQTSLGTYCDLSEYGELRALIGGTTSIHGTSLPKGQGTVPDCLKGLIRHLDWFSGLRGNAPGHEKVYGVLDVASIDAERARVLREKLDSGELDRLLIHLGEGTAFDDLSSGEFSKLDSLGLLGPKTTIIHGTAFGDREFRKMQEAGASLVWSPRSNLVLYGRTTDVAAAMVDKLAIAIAPDWSVTGSSNMLGELVFARTVRFASGNPVFSDKELFEMATAIPARLANLGDQIGSLQTGLQADLLVLRGDSSDAYLRLTTARPEDVVLVFVGGVVRLGSPELVRAALAGSADKFHQETIAVCGAKRVLVFPLAYKPRQRLVALQRRLTSALNGYHLPMAPLVECR